MKLNDKSIRLIKELQRNNPDLLLCGSVALILSGLLPKRNVSDIDFVCSDKHMRKIRRNLSLRSDPYNDLNDGYNSYSTYITVGGWYCKINVLFFKDDTQLRSDHLKSNNTMIKHQDLQDIINWKKKYNRPKDLKDLEEITLKAIEDEILRG